MILQEKQIRELSEKRYGDDMHMWAKQRDGFVVGFLQCQNTANYHFFEVNNETLKVGNIVDIAGDEYIVSIQEHSLYFQNRPFPDSVNMGMFYTNMKNEYKAQIKKICPKCKSKKVRNITDSTTECMDCTSLF